MSGRPAGPDFPSFTDSMRSITVTLFLALIASAAVGLATFQWQQGSFEAIFGKPPVPIGQVLYDDFQPEEVMRMEIRSGNLEAVFEREGQHWQTLTPWNDRMDPVAADAIIRFSLGMRVEDHSPREKIKIDESGLDKKAVRMRLIGNKGEVLAHYRIGRISSWKAEVEGVEKPVSTAFILPQDELGDKTVYLCTGDISPLFQDDLKLLRDHKPLYFRPANIQKIVIQSAKGEITLGQYFTKQGESRWRIIKPLDLPTDLEAVKVLVSGLSEMRASKVSNRSEVTLPTNGSAQNTTKIILYRHGQETPTTLEIYSPESLEATSLKAVVSDRPDTVFEIPAKPTPGMVSLSDLPLDVNSLRDPTLTRINVGALKSILIRPSTSAEILISREPRSPWMATINQRTFLANEQNVYRLLKAVTAAQVNGFESDAASDLSPWGLDRPIITLRFLAINNQALEIRFGINGRGEFFANRTGSRTVMKVDGALIQSITVLPHEWQHARAWVINPVDLEKMVIKRQGEEPLTLTHNFLKPDDQWIKAVLGTKDVTPRLVSAHANFLLTQLEGIEAARWLAKDDVDALGALADPSLVIGVKEVIKDIDDKKIGERNRTMIFAPCTVPKRHGHHYAMILGGNHPFLIGNELYQKLAADLLEE